MKKKAFIIRPFAKKFDRFCNLIMERAIRDAGYEPVLLKDNPQNGYIMKNVIENLAECEICLALITALPDEKTGTEMLNFNIAYELGIRHALFRSGTIILCDEKQKDLIEKSAFDIRDRNIVFYSSNWLVDNDDEKLCERIVSLIDAAESKKSDSPVHDHYTNLPNNLINLTATDDQRQIADMTAELDRLRTRNQELEEKLNTFGIDSTKQTKTIDFREELKQAVANSIYRSDHAVAKLRELAQEGNTDAFVDFLASVMEKGWLDEMDCHNVMVICNRFNREIEKVFLKFASETYEYEEMQVQYANELAKDPRTKEQALLIANETIGLQKKGAVFTVTKDVSSKLLGAFCNVYLRLNKNRELLQICSVLLEKYQKTEVRTLLLKNMAVCYRNLDLYEDCISTCEKAIAFEESDEIHYVLCTMYHAHSEYVNAFRELEIANSLDPSDDDYYRLLAGMVIDDRIARTSLSEDPHSISRHEVRDCALPYIIYALGNRIMSPETAVEFMRKNIQYMGEDIQRVADCLRSGCDLIEEFSDLDFSIVEESVKTGFRAETSQE